MSGGRDRERRGRREPDAHDALAQAAPEVDTANARRSQRGQASEWRAAIAANDRATEPSALAFAATKLDEAVDGAQLALVGRGFPDAALERVADAADALAEARHRHGGELTGAEGKIFEHALEKAQSLAMRLASGDSRGQRYAARLRKRLADLNHVARDRADDAAETRDPAMLVMFLDDTLAQLGQVQALRGDPDLAEAIAQTRAWHAELSGPDAKRAAARLTSAVLAQAKVVNKLAPEVLRIAGEAPTSGTAETIAAHVHALAQSTMRPDQAERSTARAVAARRHQRLDRARELAENNFDDAVALEADDFGAERRKQAKLEQKVASLDARIARGGAVSARERDEVLLEAREQDYRNGLRVLQNGLKANAGALDSLNDGFTGGVNRYETGKTIDNLVGELRGLTHLIDGALRGYTQRVAIIEENAQEIPDEPERGRAITRGKLAALDEMESLVRTHIANQRLSEMLQRAESVAKDAQLRLFLAQVGTTVLLTLAGNAAAAAARGTAEGVMIARVGTAGEAAQLPAWMRTAVTAIGMGTDLAVNTVGQKYLLGDGRDLWTIALSNAATMATAHVVTTRFVQVEHLFKDANDVVVGWNKLAVVGATLPELSLNMIVGAVTDDVVSRVRGYDVPPANHDDLVFTWMVQGAAMAFGRHLAAHSTFVKSLNEHIQGDVRRLAHAATVAADLRLRADHVAATGDAIAADAMLVRFEALLAAEKAAQRGARSKDHPNAPLHSDEATASRASAGGPRRASAGDDDVARGATLDDGRLLTQDGGGDRGGDRGDGGSFDGGGPQRAERVHAAVSRAALIAANMAGGVRLEGPGRLRLVDGGEGFAVRVEVVDLGGEASLIHHEADHAIISVSSRISEAQVERVIVRRLVEVAAATERRRAGYTDELPNALGKDAKGTMLSPDDMGRIGELRVMRRQLWEAQRAGESGAARAAELHDQIDAHERSLDIVDANPDAKRRRRMVERQVEVQNDKTRRAHVDRARDTDKRYKELHNHFMGVVDSDVFRRKAAEAAAGEKSGEAGEDAGSWVPALEMIASFDALKHKSGSDGERKRAPAGDAIEMARSARNEIRELTQRATDQDLSPEARKATIESIERLAEDAVRSALSATAHTDFNSAYEVRDELVKRTFAGKAPDRSDPAATKDYEARAFDEYTREAIRRLAADGIGYAEQSNSPNKLNQRFSAERVQAIHREMIESGELQPGQLDVRFLSLLQTRFFGERVDGNADESHLPRDTSAAGDEFFRAKVTEITDQIEQRGDTVGLDIAGLEQYLFDAAGRKRFAYVYQELLRVARKRGQPVVLRPHVGEGSVDNTPGQGFNRDDHRKRTPGGKLIHQDRAAHNVEQILLALEQAQAAGGLDPNLVIVRFGHATMATPDQAARMKALGVVAEINLGSNVRTGSADQTLGGVDGRPAPVEQFDEHSFATMLYYQTDAVLSTDGHDVMQTTLPAEYQRAHRLIEEVLAGHRQIRVRASDAGDRGTVVPGAESERWLSVEDLTPDELARFTHGYEKLHTDADTYYQHRPRPEPTVENNPPGAASPEGGAHWTDPVRQHGLTPQRGPAVDENVSAAMTFTGTRAQVEAAAAAFRSQRALVFLLEDSADTIHYRVTSADGRTTVELRGQDHAQLPQQPRENGGNP